MERAVELVCFDDGIRAFLREQQIGAVILGDASKEKRYILCAIGGIGGRSW